MVTRRVEVNREILRGSEQMKTYTGFKAVVKISEDKVFRIINKQGEPAEMKLKDIYDFLLSEVRGGEFTTILEKTLKQMGFKNDLMYVREELMKTVFDAYDSYHGKAGLAKDAAADDHFDDESRKTRPTMI